MNGTSNITNNTLVKQQKITQIKLRQLSQKNPLTKLLEHKSFNSYSERDGVYHIHTLEIGYQRGLYDMVNNCAQSTSSIVLYYLDSSDTAIFRIYNAVENTFSTMHFHGETVREAVEYLFYIKFTTEAMLLKPTKDKVFEERMKQSKTEFDGFRSFNDHLIFYDNCTALELRAETSDAFKAGIAYIKYVDHMFGYAEWVDTTQHPQKDGVYKWLWYEDDNHIKYSLCQIHNNVSFLLHDFYFSYDESLLNSTGYHGSYNEMLLLKLKPLCRKDSIDSILIEL